MIDMTCPPVMLGYSPFSLVLFFTFDSGFVVTIRPLILFHLLAAFLFFDLCSGLSGNGYTELNLILHHSLVLLSPAGRLRVSSSACTYILRHTFLGVAEGLNDGGEFDLIIAWFAKFLCSSIEVIWVMESSGGGTVNNVDSVWRASQC